jgi:hypothetical protein
MTTPRKIVASVAIAGAALLVTTGIAMANPDKVDDGGHHGGHSNSHVDTRHLGDDNECNYKYKRDGSRRHGFDGDNDDCPKINPVGNPPNPEYDHGFDSPGFHLPGL